MYNILVIGNGGREAALATSLLRDPVVQVHLSAHNYSVYDPLNRTNSSRITLANINVANFDAIADYCRKNNIHYILPGPEATICAGIVDYCQEHIPQTKCLGPNKYAAQLEGSKVFGKQFLHRCEVPTGRYKMLTNTENLDTLLEQLTFDARVVKADGLAAGKGVIVCDDLEEVKASVIDMLDNKRFGVSSETVIVEEMFSGPEISYTVWINGCTAFLFPPSSDYKRLGDNNSGPNTGGMGNVCRTPFATPELDKEFIEKVLKPILKGLQSEKLIYNGPMFIGTMIDKTGLQVLEINVRFGDPETQVIMPAIGSELFSLMQASVNNTSFIPSNSREIAENIYELDFHQKSVCVVAASQDYPIKSSEPALILGLDDYMQYTYAHPNNLELYFSGVSAKCIKPHVINVYSSDVSRETFEASGGRILSVVGYGPDYNTARTFAYEALKLINFEGMQYRSDIASF